MQPETYEFGANWALVPILDPTLTEQLIPNWTPSPIMATNFFLRVSFPQTLTFA
jgi:hypothetical protein